MEDGKLMIDPIYEDNHIIVVEKPINIPVQADDSNDLDFLTILKQYLKEKYQKPGNVYLGLVHRLDRPVSGVMVFAKTSKAARRLSEQIRLRQMKKIYHAVVLGILNDSKGIFKDHLLKNSINNTVNIDPKGKEAILEYQVLQEKDNLSLVQIDLTTGRSHQIRVQFASRNHPLYGDQKYCKTAKIGEQIALIATELSFFHPITKEWMTFTVSDPARKPWNLFK